MYEPIKNQFSIRAIVFFAFEFNNFPFTHWPPKTIVRNSHAINETKKKMRHSQSDFLRVYCENKWHFNTNNNDKTVL